MSSVDYDVQLFPDEKNRSFWMNVLRTLDNVYDIEMWFGFFMSVIGIPINILHMFILSRATMRTSSTNIILLGISICDLMILLTMLQLTVRSYYYFVRGDANADCDTPSSYFELRLDDFITMFSTMSRRTSIWLGVSLAIIRTFVMKKPLSHCTSTLTGPRFGLFSNLFVLVICSPLSILNFLQYTIVPYKAWIPPVKCGFPVNFSQMEYIPKGNGWFDEKSVIEAEEFLEGFFEFLPCLILPPTTILLVLEVRKRKQLRNNSSQRSGRSTKLVLFMTISFLFATGPLGIVDLLDSFCSDLPGFSRILQILASMFRLFMSFNALIHCLICFLISTQYRNAAKVLFLRQKPPFNTSLIAVQAVEKNQ